MLVGQLRIICHPELKKGIGAWGLIGEGAMNEMALEVYITNTNAGINLSLKYNVIKQLISLMNNMSPQNREINNECKELMARISPPPFILNLATFQIDPFKAHFDVDNSMFRVYERELMVPEERVMISGLYGDVGEVLGKVFNGVNLKEKSFKDLFSLLLWVMSGFFPQLSRISEVRNMFVGLK